jgi:3',5'-cyclic AMP phosphodiesterase CpdA
MHKLIHITDPHLIAPGRRLYALDPLERFHGAIAAVLARHGDAAAVFITGDLTHWGEPEAYAALREAVGRLPMPCHLVVGNHDVRAAFHESFPEAPSDDEGFVQYVVDLPGAKGLVLDTLVDGAGYGLLCEARLGWLERTLPSLKGHDLLVFLHHAPFRVGIPAMDKSRLREGAERLGALLRDHGRTRHLFHGHLHRPLAGSWQGIPCSTVPATAHQILLDYSEPRTVYGSHEPPAIGVVFWDSETLVVHQESYLDSSPRFSLDEGEEAQSLAELPQL